MHLNKFNKGFSLLEITVGLSMSCCLLLMCLPMMTGSIRSIMHWGDAWSFSVDALTLHAQMLQLLHTQRCAQPGLVAYQHFIPHNSLPNETLQLSLYADHAQHARCNVIRLFVDEDLHLSQPQHRVWSLFLQVVNGSRPDVLVSYVSSMSLLWGFNNELPLWRQTHPDLPFERASRVQVLVEFVKGARHLKQVYSFNINQRGSG